MSVAGNIITLRERQGLNQKELAESLNMNRSVLNRIENGTRPVRDDELKIIADYFNVSADYLLGRETPKAPTLSDEQTTVLSGFDALNSAGRKLLVAILNSLRISRAATV
ncbi:MAG: helix-turn-helix transcriptional regulator [Selenomonadaceae bacterium]|nr:helix-turn-helix transcriptional regulator [Selenomonadaceae bacterium]